jgi:hypothetical protein
MRIYKIKVLPNKEMKCINGNIVCKKGENKIDVLSFSVDDDLLQFNNFLILRSPSGTTYIDILTNDLEYIIGSFITNDLGDWSIQFISSTQEDIVVESEIDETQIVMISDVLKIKVIDSLASGELVLPPTSANLDLLGEQLATIYNTLSIVIEEYPQVENYIELQEELKVIEDMIANIKVDVGEVTIDNTEVLNAIDEVKEDIANINIDLSPISAKLDDLSEQVENIPTNDYSSDIAQIKGQVNTINMVVQNNLVSNTNAIKADTNYTNEKVIAIENNIGNNDTKKDGTLFNYTYWGLVRAEEAKSAALSNNTMLQTIFTQMSDANTLSDEILSLLEG